MPPYFKNGENVTVSKSELEFTRYRFLNVPVRVPFSKYIVFKCARKNCAVFV